MNDRAVAVFEQYDMEITRTYKGRGTMLAETPRGLFVLKEYKGRPEKLELLDRIQKQLQDSVRMDMLVRSKEGALCVKDADGVVYLVKESIEGRECSYRSEEDIKAAFALMAKLHLLLSKVVLPQDTTLSVRSFYAQEMEKHTRECRHIRNYLRHLKSRSEFERELLLRYDDFLEKAQTVTGLARQEDEQAYAERIIAEGLLYHGDYQYHNILFDKRDISIINMERFGRDSGVKDFYLLFRKISEKTDWSPRLGSRMLEAYERIRPLADWERRQLAYRLAYPDKFWKVVNFYYNSRKSRISDKTIEKLDTLVAQEEARQRLLKALF